LDVGEAMTEFARGVVSFPKCGRTWIRLFLEYYKRLGGADSHVVFRHSEELSMTKRVMLIRHPCDVMVSFWMHRRVRRRSEMPFRDFVESEQFGLPRFNREHLIWSARKDNQLVVRYEDLFNPNAWVDLLRFFDVPIDYAALDEATDATRFNTIRHNLDEISTFPTAWRYLAAENGNYDLVEPDNPEGHKFRRGKVGGYVDYLSKDDAAYVLDNFTLGETLEHHRRQYLLGSEGHYA
jgi:hypothetical protein